MRMSRITGAALASALLLGGCADTPLSPSGPARDMDASGGTATSYSGRATVVDATLLGLEPIRLVHVEIPSSGGAEEDDLASAELPNGLGTLEVLHASTVAQGDESRTEASAANVDLVVGGNTIKASFLRAEAQAVCSADGKPTQSGNSEVLDLTINGEQIVVGTAPNQRVALPGGSYVIINEQDTRTTGNHGEITVNALRVVIIDPVTGEETANVIIASAHADIACAQAPPCPDPNDFVTGGGWVDQPGATRKNFAAAGGIKNGAFWGHLVFQDHGQKVKVRATEIDGYGPATGDYPPNARSIRGFAEVNGQPGHRFHAIVADVAEPGRGRDYFELKVDEVVVYAADTLDGGNIQLHGKTCSK